MVLWHAPSVLGVVVLGLPPCEFAPLAGRPPRCDWPAARPVGPWWSGGALLVSEVGGTQHLLRPVIFMLACTGRRCSSGDGGQRRVVSRAEGTRAYPLDLRFVNVGRQAGLATIRTVLRRARAAVGPGDPTESLWAGATPGGLLKFRTWGPRSLRQMAFWKQRSKHVQWPASFHPVRRGALAESGLLQPFAADRCHPRLAQVRHAQARLAQVVGVALEVGPVAVIPQWISKMQVECRGRERLSIEPDSRRVTLVPNRW